MGHSSGYTLKHRIITLMALFSIILTGSFCAIQVKNQLSTITTFNSYRARLSAMIIKNQIEKTMAENALDPSANIIQSLKSEIMALKSSKIIEDAVILNKKCEVMVTSGAASPLNKLKPADYRIVEECTLASQKEKWFTPNVDTVRGVIDLYIPLMSGDNFEYIARTTFSLGNIRDALGQVYIPIIMTIVVVILVNVILGSILTKTIVKPISILNTATKKISEGDLTLKVNIRTRDEIEELGETFNHMTGALLRMKERAENANPLTKLPGNNMIHEEIDKRLNSNTKFIVVYSDLDNFKAFNDKYGIGAGDKAIKLTADVMRESIKKFGSSEDFLGHEGGDDFVLVTVPARVEPITKYITEEFDKRVRGFYSKEDLAQGYILAHARDGSVQKFPTMTISLAGVGNEKRALVSYGEITNICAEVKKKAKGAVRTGSLFVMDKRTD